MRQRSPLAAVLHYVEDGIENLSPRVETWASTAQGAARCAWFRHMWRNHSPFVIIEVSRVDSSGLIRTHSLSLPDCPRFA